MWFISYVVIDNISRIALISQRTPHHLSGKFKAYDKLSKLGQTGKKPKRDEII